MRTQARRELDDQLSRRAVPARPHSGWLKAIRDALGMSTTQLAARAGVSQQAIASLERSETEGTIGLAALRKVADALGCDLQYVLVPRHPDGLTGMVRDQARAVAARELAPVRHTMALEDQQLPSADDERELELLAEELMDRPRVLWSRNSR